MNPLEIELLKAIAASPIELPKYLISPQTDMNRKWFSGDLAVRVFTAIAKNATEGKRATLVGIIIDAKPSKEDFDIIKAIWDNPVAMNEDDVNALTESFKNDALKREAQSAIDEYEENVRLAPSVVRRSIDILGTTLSIISRDGIAYDPNPVSHFQDSGWELSGSWGRDMKGLDIVTRGGMPRRALWIYISPSGMSKTTLGATLAAASVIRGEPVAIIDNEADAGPYSRRLRDAVTFMYGGQEYVDSATVDRQISQYATVWERIISFEKVRQILYWCQPHLSVMDSITRIAPPEKLINSRMADSKQHEVKADSLLALSREFNTLIYAPGNGSSEEQKNMVNKFESVTSAMLFGSIAYHNAADISTISIRHPSRLFVQRMKTVKDRPTGKIGDIVDLTFSPVGRCYYGGEYASAMN